MRFQLACLAQKQIFSKSIPTLLEAVDKSSPLLQTDLSLSWQIPSFVASYSPTVDLIELFGLAFHLLVLLLPVRIDGAFLLSVW